MDLFKFFLKHRNKKPHTIFVTILMTNKIKLYIKARDQLSNLYKS